MRLPDLMPSITMALLLTLTATAPAAENVISGTVRYLGQSNNVASSKIQLGTNQTVHEAIVYLAGLSTKAMGYETNAATLDQQKGLFVPHIQIARSGAPLILRNSDPTLHVIQIESLSGTNGAKTLLKVAMPYAGYEKKYRLANFTEPTLLRVSAANDPNAMTAYIAVMPHPWAALTDENGRFALHNVPTGKHKIYAWHEVLGTLVRDITNNNDRTGTMDFLFTPARSGGG